MSYDLFATPGDTAAAPDTVERLFLGLMLPAPQAAEATEVLDHSRETQGLRGNPIRPDRLHITLIHVGDYANALPGSVVESVRQAAAALAAPAFDITLDRVSSFSGAPGKHPHVLLAQAVG
ncbi:MAG: 2'-5' RNA ligase, partial [Brevundimonas sp.]